MDERDRYDLGLSVRREVLGDPHVDASLAARTPLTAEFQDLITRLAWGELWTRPTPDRTTRRLLTISMLIALNREAELQMHLRAALSDGVPRDLLKEVCLHSAVYCGLPAANSAFAILADLTTNAS